MDEPTPKCGVNWNRCSAVTELLIGIGVVEGGVGAEVKVGVGMAAAAAAAVVVVVVVAIAETGLVMVPEAGVVLVAGTMLITPPAAIVGVGVEMSAILLN